MEMEVENMTLPELKAVLAKYNLETTGKRGDLVSRLNAHLKRPQKEAAKSPKLGPKSTAKGTANTTASSKVGTTPTNKGGTTTTSKGPTTTTKGSTGKVDDLKGTTTTTSTNSNGQALKESVTQLSMEQRLALRAKRFNLPQTTTTTTTTTSSSTGKGVKDKLSKFERRFKNKKMHLEVDEEELRRRQLRLERFKVATTNSTL